VSPYSAVQRYYGNGNAFGIAGVFAGLESGEAAVFAAFPDKA
jgi:hypothetical protein